MFELPIVGFKVCGQNREENKLVAFELPIVGFKGHERSQ